MKRCEAEIMVRFGYGAAVGISTCALLYESGALSRRCCLRIDAKPTSRASRPPSRLVVSKPKL